MVRRHRLRRPDALLQLHLCHDPGAYLQITRVGGGGTNNITGQTNTVIVGEQVALTCQFVDPATGLPSSIAPITNYQWSIPGTYVSNYVTTVTNGTVYYLTNASDFTNSSITYYWVEGSGGSPLEVQCTAIAQGVTMTAKAKFNVTRPTASLTASITGAIALDNNFLNNEFALHFGWNPVGIIFDYTATNSGTWDFAQLMDNFLVRQRDPADGQWYRVQGSGLDTVFPYPRFRPPGTSDSPGVPVLPDAAAVTVDWSFTMYLMFKPTGGIYVPIRKIGWGWNAAATRNVTWGSPTGAPYVDANDTDATNHPQWTDNFIYIRARPPVAE